MQPIHFAANILDPRYNGDHLTRSQNTLGMEVIFDRANYLYGENSNSVTEILTDLAHYKEKQGTYSTAFVQNTIKTLPSIIWWKTNNSDPKLSSIAVDILSMRPTSSATERTFSKYGNVHTTKRNRLLTDRARMLTYISFNLKVLLETEGREKRKQKRCLFVTP